MLNQFGINKKKLKFDLYMMDPWKFTKNKQNS